MGKKDKNEQRNITSLTISFTNVFQKSTKFFYKL